MSITKRQKLTATSKQKTVSLISGQDMPLVGLGTWKIQKKVCAETVYLAIKSGYRLLDCASDYGNEKEVGEGIKAAINDGTVQRKDLFITSKLWNTYHAKEHVMTACKKTLSDLGLDYLDLYLIHFPICLKYVDFETRYPPGWAYDPDVKNDNPGGCEFVPVPVFETWTAMEELVGVGLVKNIGVSNFNCQLLMDLLAHKKIPPSVLQIEHHLYLQQPRLVNFAKSKGIAITGYSNFGGESFVELDHPLAKEVTSLLKCPDIIKIATKHAKTTAQVCLKWIVQNKVAVVPKSINPKRLVENLDLFEFELDAEDMKMIKALDAHGRIRFNNPGEFIDYPIFD